MLTQPLSTALIPSFQKGTLMVQILANSQVIVEDDEVRSLMDRANYTGHPELVYLAEAKLRDGDSEDSVAGFLAGEMDVERQSKPAPKTRAKADDSDSDTKK